MKGCRKRTEEWPGGTFSVQPSYRFDVPGGVKMSKVLEEFVELFLTRSKGLEAYRRLLCLGELAWNAALCSEPERGDDGNKALRYRLPGATPGISPLADRSWKA